MIYDGDERAIVLARYISETKGTVREAAKHFGISKSTEVKEILERNKAQRHIRGGQATKEKYADMRLHGVRT